MSSRELFRGLRRNRVVSTLMSDHHSSMNMGQDFKLRSGREFQNRAESVFGNLEEADLSKSSTSFLVSNDSAGSDDEDEANKFTKPTARAPKKRFRTMTEIPDYMKSPKKWKKYSLSDVPEHSERTNSAAATEFLSSLKEKNYSGGKTLLDAKTMRYTKPDDSAKEDAYSTLQDPKPPAFTRIAFVMPECVVGQKVSAQKKVGIVHHDKKKEIRLAHLDDGEEEC